MRVDHIRTCRAVDVATEGYKIISTKVRGLHRERGERRSVKQVRQETNFCRSKRERDLPDDSVSAAQTRRLFCDYLLANRPHGLVQTVDPLVVPADPGRFPSAGSTPVAELARVPSSEWRSTS